MKHLASLLSVLFVVGLLPVTPVAAEATSSITFVFESPFPDEGQVTLLEPTQETKRLPSANFVLENPVPGNHTVFSSVPAGTATTMQLWQDGVLLLEESVPQMTFTVGMHNHLKIVIRQTLTAHGTVGVSTEPSGMPFILTGPGGIREEGISPHTFERMPIGSYGVRFTPKGCPEPPPQGSELKYGQKTTFRLSITCDTFEPTRDRSKDKNVGQLTFVDVRQDDWFAADVFQMVHQGILSGYKDEAGSSTGMFGPGDAVTIAQLSKIAHTFTGTIPREVVPELLEHKAAAGTWFQNYVRSAEENDWRVFLDPNLDLSRPATRGEILVTFLQVLDIPLQWPKGKAFRDVTRRTPYASAIETAATLGIVQGKTGPNGKPTGYFGPLEPVNRAELSKMLNTLKIKYAAEAKSQN